MKRLLVMLLLLPIQAEDAHEPIKMNLFKIQSSCGFYQVGFSSWYGPRFHGRRTAAGNIFNQNKLSAAHRRLPTGSRIKVVNLSNGEDVVLRVEDRGPYIRGRVLDLSKAAADCLKFLDRGLQLVRIDTCG